MTRHIGFLAIVLLATAFGLAAQEPGLQMNVTSSLLPLDVIVKDSSGRPVLPGCKNIVRTHRGGKYRRIEVRVRRPGLVVTQSRDGFQP